MRDRSIFWPGMAILFPALLMGSTTLAAIQPALQIQVMQAKWAGALLQMVLCRLRRGTSTSTAPSKAALPIGG